MRPTLQFFDDDILSINGLITNGNFSKDDKWVKGAGWSITGGQAVCDGSQPSSTLIRQNNVFTEEGDYRVTFDLVLVAGQIRPLVGSNGIGSYETATGAVSQIVTRAGGLFHFYLQANSDFIGTVDNLTVTKV